MLNLSIAKIGLETWTSKKIAKQTPKQKAKPQTTKPYPQTLKTWSSWVIVWIQKLELEE